MVKRKPSVRQKPRALTANTANQRGACGARDVGITPRDASGRGVTDHANRKEAVSEPHPESTTICNMTFGTIKISEKKTKTISYLP